MERILFIVAIAIFYSSPSLAADGDRASVGFRYTLTNYHKDGFDGIKPTPWVSNYGQLTNKNSALEERSVDDSLERMSSALGKNIDLGIAPMFGSDGVFRTRSSQDKSTYVALGFTLDELAMDEAGTSNSWDDGGLSYGFGVNHSSFNIEYMIHMDDGIYDVSAISMGLTSEF